MLDNVKVDQFSILLTRNCNLRCNFCYAKEGGYVRNDNIDYEQLKKIIDLCDCAGAEYVVFVGGEPSLYPKLVNILKYIKSRKYKMIPTMATNGIALKDMNYCKQLIDNGLSYIDISLKGNNEKECCETTGYDCFSQQMTAISNLSVLPIDFTCSMVLTWNSVNTFCKGVKSAYDNGARQFSFTFIIDNDESEEKDLLYLEKHNPFALINAFISQIDKLNSITDDWWIEYSFPMCVYTEEQLLLLKGRLAAPCHVHQGNAVTFDTKTNLLLCDMCFESKIGQFGKDFSSYKEFEELIKSDHYNCIKDSLKRLPSSECSSCRYLKSCYGGCPVIWKNYSFEALKKFKKIST